MRPSPAAIAFDIADRQDGCLTHDQLTAAGLSLGEITGLLTRQIVAPVHRAIYVVATRQLTARQLQTCALLRASPLAGLSHRTGCEVRELLPARPGVAEVTTSRRGMARALSTMLPMRETGRPGLILTSGASAPLASLEQVAGLPSLPLARTLIDLAGRHGTADARRAWREADFRGLLDPAAIAAELHPGARRAGVVALRKLWDQEGIVGRGRDLRSRNERRFLRMIEAAGLPVPAVNERVRVGDDVYRLDFYWHAARVALEIDGSGHRRRFATEADIDRDIALTDAGIELVRFPDDIAYSRTAWCIEQLAAVLVPRLEQAA